MTGKEVSDAASAGSNATAGTQNELGFVVGQIVVAAIDLVDLDDDGHRTLLYAAAGEELVVRRIPWSSFYPIGVSRPNVTGGSFGARAHEVTESTKNILVGDENRRSVASGNTSEKMGNHMRN